MIFFPECGDPVYHPHLQAACAIFTEYLFDKYFINLKYQIEISKYPLNKYFKCHAKLGCFFRCDNFGNIMTLQIRNCDITIGGGYIFGQRGWYTVTWCTYQYFTFLS